MGIFEKLVLYNLIKFGGEKQREIQTNFQVKRSGSRQIRKKAFGSVARVQTHRHTDTQTDTKVNTEDTLSGFQEFLLQPIIKDLSNN